MEYQCPACKGTGHKTDECPTCEGTLPGPCRDCNGTGKVNLTPLNADEIRAGGYKHPGEIIK